MLDERAVKIYNDNLEDQPMASDEVRKAYKALNAALDDYINAICLDSFCWGYELGRKERAAE